MKVSYFPGCTLRTKAKELDRCARACAEILGFELCEIENWQCCGGVYVSAKDEIATKLAAVRALAAARDAGRPLVTVCSACHNVIKQTNHAMRTDEDFAKKVNLYLSQDKNPPAPYHGETEVLHYLELVTRGSGFEKIHAAVKNPLNGKRVAAYYGCMLLRPAKVIEFDDPENPQLIENSLPHSEPNPAFSRKETNAAAGIPSWMTRIQRQNGAGRFMGAHAFTVRTKS